MTDSSTEAGSTGLDGLNLHLGVWQTVEAPGQFGTVEDFTLPGLNRAQRSTRAATNSTLSERSTTKRAVLLGLGTVGSERVGQDSGRRQRVGSGRVVYLCFLSVSDCCQRFDFFFFGPPQVPSEHLRGTERLPRKRMRGVWALRRATVARIVMV